MFVILALQISIFYSFLYILYFITFKKAYKSYNKNTKSH